jgi:bifunctional UDP-N-acetylglucosamine pyrophosphorylase/glucosamine-1-phosphate N-acetyltransferase
MIANSIRHRTPSSKDPGRELHIVILAAGEGTRMKMPGLSKVLLKLRDRTLIEMVMAVAESLAPDSVNLVVGFRAGDVMRTLSGRRVVFVFQTEQLGTGHAVLQAERLLRDRKGDLLVLLGDVPLIQADTLRRLIAEHRARGAAATVLSTELDEPAGYGRIVRNGEGALLGIVEDRDAGPDELRIREIHSGIFCFTIESVFDALHRVGRENAQKQYYLTEVVRILRESGKTVHCVQVESPVEVLGVNRMEDLLTLRRSLSSCAESSATSAKDPLSPS